MSQDEKLKLWQEKSALIEKLLQNAEIQKIAVEELNDRRINRQIIKRDEIVSEIDMIDTKLTDKTGFEDIKKVIKGNLEKLSEIDNFSIEKANLQKKIVQDKIEDIKKGHKAIGQGYNNIKTYNNGYNFDEKH